MPYVYSNEAPLYYEVCGEGTPLVFIHPPAFGHIVFKKQAVLAEKFRLILFDMRGNGRSGSGHEAITMPLLADDIVAIIDELDHDQVVICGYSNGGSIAQEFALRYPERTAGLILCGGFSEVDTFLLSNEFRLGIYTVQLQAMTALSKVLAKAHCKTKTFANELEQYIRKSNPHIIYEMYVCGLDYRCTERLSELKAPLLLIYGGWDLVVPQYRHLFTQYVKTTIEIAYVERATHQIPTKNFNEFNQIITQFIDEKVERRL